MTANSIPAANRMLGIDAARGLAMFFSCLVHYGWWIEGVHPGITQRLTSIGMVATPTFLLLSGAVTGWLCGNSRNPLKTRWKLLNRGLFLITVGHILISLAEAHRDGGLRRTIGAATIIDDIGLCMLCCAVWFTAIRRESVRRALIWYGIGGYAICWLCILLWHPAADGWLMVRQGLLGPDSLGSAMDSYTSPTLPYVCLFAIGLGASDWLASAATQSERARQQRVALLVLGGSLMLSAALLHGARLLIDREAAGAGSLAAINLTLTATSKLPPAPAYVMFYGGAALVICGLSFRLAFSSFVPARRFIEGAAVVGRASLFVFVLQYFVFWTLPDLVGMSSRNVHLVPTFLAGLVIIWCAAWLWNLVGGNRFLTLGLNPRPAPA